MKGTLAIELATMFDELWPLNRSVTGESVRKTHDILSRVIPLQRIEIPSGTKVFDWTVPKEWRVREAYILTPDGRRVADVADNNLHLMGYSVPFRGRLTKAELESHLYSLPGQPSAIPYRTTYYQPRWGFCMSQDMRDSLPEGEYEVVVDTELFDGSLTMSEAVLPGTDGQEIMFATYTCHPSMAHNELSGPLVTAFLYRAVAALPSRRYTYRFIFVPETIGAISYLAMRGEHLRDHVVAGYVVNCCGDSGAFTYKKSRRENSLADRAALAVLRSIDPKLRIREFDPGNGSDERQYCSPGFNLPIGSIMRTMYGEYSEYHTSLDNRDFIDFVEMARSVEVYAKVVDALEGNRFWVNKHPYGEPFLGARGLYADTEGRSLTDYTKALVWLLNYADGEHDLFDIAERSGFCVEVLMDVVQRCRHAGLLEERQDAA